MKDYSGSCLCGSVGFKIHGEFESFYFCHCKRCKKNSGSSNAANLFSTSAKFDWLKGEELVTSFTVESTRHSRSFCSCCGSALPSIRREGKLIVVPAGSLDQEIDTAPTAHIFCSSKAGWEDRLDRIPRYEGLPPSKGS